jgi:hypothetical protein
MNIEVVKQEAGECGWVVIGGSNLIVDEINGL